MQKLVLPNPKNEIGYTSREVLDIIKTYKIHHKTFWKKFGIATCPVLPGGIYGYFTWDVELTIRLCLEKRDRTLAEWD